MFQSGDQKQLGMRGPYHGLTLISDKLYSLNIMSGTDIKRTIQKEILILMSGQEGVRQD